MDSETRAALAALSNRMDQGFADMRAGFARVDRFFELQQLQFVEWRAELRGEMAGLRTRPLQADDDLRRDVAALTVRVERLEERQSH